MKNSDWHPPENIYVKVDGEDVLVPEIDEYLISHVSEAISDSQDRMRGAFEVSKWVRSLDDKEIFAAFQYFADKWTWETGNPWDKFFWRVFETESKRRRELLSIVTNAVISSSLISEVLDIMKKTDGDT